MKKLTTLLGVFVLAALLFAPFSMAAPTAAERIADMKQQDWGQAKLALATILTNSDFLGGGVTLAELDYLDITALGTGAASKAVVLDASGDYTYPATATIIYPSGATLTLESGSTLNVAGAFQIGGVGMSASAAELNYNDITALGTGAASKAVVLDGSGDYTYPATATIIYPSGATLTLQSGSTIDIAGTFNIGGVGMTAGAAELNYLDITALGTGAASKAVVLDGSGDYTYPATATIIYPSGATLTLQSGSTIDIAGTFNIGGVGMTAGAAELNYLDITALGTGAASKAVVLDGSGDYTYPATATIIYPSGATLTLQSGSTLNIAGTWQIGAVGVDVTAAELNLLDDSAVANDTASVAVIMDANKEIRSTAHEGTAGTGCTAVHWGDGKSMFVEITITTADIDVVAAAAEGHGWLIYTFPAGALVVTDSYLDYELTTADACTADTPESALGTVIGAGAIATLTGTTMEDLSAVGSSLVLADCNGTAEVSSLGPSAANGKMVIETGDAHTAHVNFADTWAGADADIALTGTVRFAYTYLD
jgi:hypothetical protein